MGAWGWFGFGGGAKMACGREAIDSLHGTCVEGSLHPCTKDCTPSKGLLFFLLQSPHMVLMIHCILNVVTNFLCYSHFSPLQIENKPFDRDMKYAFILGPVSLVANTFDTFARG
jgi:hypothetical protein